MNEVASIRGKISWAAVPVVALLGLTASAIATLPASAAVGCAAFSSGVHDVLNPQRSVGILTANTARLSGLQASGYTDNRSTPFSVATASSRGISGVAAAHVMYDRRSGDRVYAVDAGEIRQLKSAGRVDNGTAFYVATRRSATCLIPVYRFTRGGLHRYETLLADRVALRENGWRQEGVAFYAGKPPSDTKFTFAVLPDTQQEVLRKGDTRFANRTRWLVNNRRKLDLRFVTHTGDIVNWDTPNHSQYVVAQNALRVLRNGGVPFSLSPGNHDTAAVCNPGGACDPRRTRQLARNTRTFNAYLGFGTTNLRGQFERGKLDNSYHTFAAGNRKWLVLNLEIWPRANVMSWAKNVVATHPHYNVIVATHSYMTSRGRIYGKSDYGVTSPRALYAQLISRYANVRLVVCGHAGKAAHRVDRGVHGNRIDSFMLTMHDLWTNPTRLVEIDTRANTLRSWVYSPYTNKRYPSYTVKVSRVRWVR